METKTSKGKEIVIPGPDGCGADLPVFAPSSTIYADRSKDPRTSNERE